MATGLPAFPEFNLRDQTNLATRWEKYLKRLKNLMTAMKMTDEGRKRALLLHYIGEEVNDLFDTLPDKGEDNDFNKACDALTQYFTPKKTVSFEIFKFRSLKQEPHETVDEFHARLQITSKYCEFGDNKEREIKAQIELGTTNKKLRRYSFRTPTLTLTALLDYARTLHETEKQAKGIEEKSQNSPILPCDEAVHKVQFNKQKYPNSYSSGTGRTQYTQLHIPTDPPLAPKPSAVFAADIHGPIREPSVPPKDNNVTTAPNTTILPVSGSLHEREITQAPAMLYKKMQGFHPRTAVVKKLQKVTMTLTMRLRCRNRPLRSNHVLFMPSSN